MGTRHVLLKGDCLHHLAKLPEDSVELVFADPPYNISKKAGLSWAFSKHVTMQEAWDIFNKDDFFKFNVEWLSESLRVLKPGGSIFVCGSYHNIYQLGFILQQLGVRVNNSVIWYKPNAQPNITCRMFTESTEQLIWAVKPGQSWTFNYQEIKALNNGKQMRNLWEIPVTPKSEKSAGIHPTQKPTELLRRVILAATKKGDVVLDPFVGSGTTSVVAKMLGRNSIGIDNESNYIRIAKKRLANTKVQTEPTFFRLPTANGTKQTLPV